MMLKRFHLIGIAGSIGIYLFSVAPVMGQISPDRTTNSSVNHPSAHDYRIEGGTRRGQNLFHSFEQLNIEPGDRVIILDQGAANILLRVTGHNRSRISGALAVDGNANLFLLNPNGITFGQDATVSLNGGSFVATTANAIQFGNQGNFSATNPPTA